MSLPSVGGPAMSGSHPSFRLPRLDRLRGLVLPVVLLLLWDLAARRGGYGFATLDEIGRTFVQALSGGDLGRNVWVSLLRVVFGLLVGGSLGVAIGAGMALSPTVDRVLGPVFTALRQVPTLGWIPLLGLWFGYGELPKLLIVTKAAMFPLILNTYEGLKGVKPQHLDVARVLELGPWRSFWRVRLPSALPMIVTGLQQALAFTWIACIGVEILFGAGEGAGIGAMIEQGQTQSRMDVVVLGVLIVGVIAFALTKFSNRVAAPALRWRDLRSPRS